MYLVKVRKVGDKTWKFLSSGGGVNRLRIHAVQFADKTRADSCVADIAESNSGEWEAKVVEEAA